MTTQDKTQELAKAFKTEWYTKYKIAPDFIITNPFDLHVYQNAWQEYYNKHMFTEEELGVTQPQDYTTKEN